MLEREITKLFKAKVSKTGSALPFLIIPKYYCIYSTRNYKKYNNFSTN